MFGWKWYLSDIKQDKDVTVFSTFSCGGGSSMGYKRAGFNVLGNVEIDPSINQLYKNNLHPKYSFEMDLRDFNSIGSLPDELYHLDILDGSPPCSTFSLSGDREDSWGKKKVFREGQKEQRLDDLFMVFLDTVKKLKPKIAVAENVTGLVLGNARGYVSEIISRFRGLGYEVQIFKLNSAKMEVPQTRERIFFIANRCGYRPLSLEFNYPAITFGEVRTEHGRPVKAGSIAEKTLELRTPADRSLFEIYERTGQKPRCFNQRIFHDGRVADTIVSNSVLYRYCDGKKLSIQDYVNVQTFPQDYEFCGRAESYVCGMSVPPNMMAHIADSIYQQWLK